MNTSQIMFSLIQSEIGGRATEELKEPLTSDVYENLYNVSSQHKISNIIACALSSAGLLGKDEISEKFRNDMMFASFADDKIEYTLAKTSEILENAEIFHIPLKGSVIRNFYPQTYMRTRCDVDVLIKYEDSQKAIDKLCEAGFVFFADMSGHDHNLVAPGGVHLELHYRLMKKNAIPFLDKMLESVWDYTEPEQNFRFRLKMTSEYFLFFHIAHMAKHFLNGGCGIRTFLDLWILENNMSFDKEKLNILLDTSGLNDFYMSSLELIGVWFENTPHSELTRQMEEYILSGGAYGTLTNGVSVSAAKGESKYEYFLKLVFLPAENLKLIYPNLNKHPYLLPYYQIKRWLKILSKNKRDKIHNMVNERNDVSDDDIKSTTELLKDLGLNI